MTVIYVEQSSPIRLDVYLAAETGYTRSHIKQMLDSGYILLNGVAAGKSGKMVSAGDQIIIDEPQRTLDILPQDIPLDILYEDADLAVINKQAGLSVHPAGGALTDTLVNALLYHFKDLSKINGVIRPGIVHRLDKDTSGVMVVAKNDAAHLSLSRQIADRAVKKLYLALLEGRVKEDSGKIDTLIGRCTSDRKKMAVVSDGRQATTFFRVLERFDNATYAEFDLLTGRTHQIRVHAKHIGHPVLGDHVYGFKKQKFKLDGQLLHSNYLQFIHPKSGKKVDFTAPPPKAFTYVLEILRKSAHEESIYPN